MTITRASEGDIDALIVKRPGKAAIQHGIDTKGHPMMTHMRLICKLVMSCQPREGCSSTYLTRPLKLD